MPKEKRPVLRASALTIRGQQEVPFCPAGPRDVHIQWLMNGHSVDTTETHRTPLGKREVLVSSCLRGGPLIKEARYHCVAKASTGSDTSEIDLHLTTGDENIPSRDVNQWRSALTEHEQLLKKWEKAWESCDGHTAG
ncbi:uncharacterized protein V3H82_026716 [Fundulus diaphanus]